MIRLNNNYGAELFLGMRLVPSAGLLPIKRSTIGGGVCAAVLVLLAVAAGYRDLDRDVRPEAVTSPAIPPSTTQAAAETYSAPEAHQGFLHGRITTVEGARLTLYDGEELQLEPTGDLREESAGLLIFADGRERPDYVPWTDVERVDFDCPPATYPALGGR